VNKIKNQAKPFIFYSHLSLIVNKQSLLPTVRMLFTDQCRHIMAAVRYFKTLTRKQYCEIYNYHHSRITYHFRVLLALRFLRLVTIKTNKGGISRKYYRLNYPCLELEKLDDFQIAGILEAIDAIQVDQIVARYIHQCDFCPHRPPSGVALPVFYPSIHDIVDTDEPLEMQTPPHLSTESTETDKNPSSPKRSDPLAD
jgi:hypothetical protein